MSESNYNYNIYIRHHKKEDNRDLFLFGKQKHTLEPTNDMPPLTTKPCPHKRWNPFNKEWVIYSPSRQDRTFNPPKEYCPLCAVKKDGYKGEIPFESFEVAVFENRFAGLHLDAPKNLDSDYEYSPASGRCEVVVYSAEHEGNLGKMNNERRETLVQAWIHRYLDLRSKSEIKFVMPFENRGEEVGVTLPHPHGQIYSFEHIPTMVENMAQSFRTNNIFTKMLQDKDLIVEENEHFCQLVPSFARFPFESWIVPKQKLAGPWEFTPQQVVSYAHILGQVIKRYDAIFNQTMPYIMLMYASPKGEEKTFAFHTQFLPFKRDKNKLKFLAGCEQGTNVFLADLLPNDVAKRLREIQV